MRTNGFSKLLVLAALASAAIPSHAAGFGTVTSIAGQASDIALDESRGILYVANFTASRIDEISTTTGAILTSINVSAWPSSVAMSPDSQYLIVTHYGAGFTRPGDFNGLTVIRLADNTRVTYGTGDPPLAVAFFNPLPSGPGKAMVVTTTGYFFLDPTNGITSGIAPLSDIVSTALPVSNPTFPSQILKAAMATSADRFTVWGLFSAGTGAQVLFKYDSRSGAFGGLVITSTPVLQPRLSVSSDGGYAMVGHLLVSTAYAPGRPMVLAGRFPTATSVSNITGHAIDSKNNLIYAQIPSNATTGPTTSTSVPTLMLMDSDNLTLRDQVVMPQNMVGRALLNSTGTVIYAISDSGVMTLPVGSLNKYPRLAASTEDVMVQTSFCVRGNVTQTFTINDPGGNHTDFAIHSNASGVTVSPASGTTPATVTVTVDPSAFETLGTTAVTLSITSNSAINFPSPVRVLLSNPDQNQRGTIVNVPGTLTDILPDNVRNRFYILRKDVNQLMVFDGSNYQKLTAMRTATTPVSMSMSLDSRFLLVAHNDSQLVTVYDLDKMQQVAPVIMPNSQYAQSIAASNGNMLAVVRDESGQCSPAGGTGCLDVIDFVNRTVSTPATLGIYQNQVSSTSVLAPTPNGASILVASPDGSMMLYSADNNTYNARKNSPLTGAYAASSYNTYIVGNTIFDSSLVPMGTLDAAQGTTTGFFFTGQGGYRVSATAANGPGRIQNLSSLTSTVSVLPIVMTEAPLLPTTTSTFTRTVAPMTGAGTVVVLSTSGVTVLSQNYAVPSAPPSINRVVSAADGSSNLAAGGLISVYGSSLAPTTAATSQIPLPTALANSCLVVNGTPIHLLFVSNGQANAQLPFNVAGNATMSIHTPGGISNNFNFTVASGSPSVFLSGTAGPETGLATIVRADNGQLVTPTNPIHYNDTVTIYLTGLGQTSPAVDAGQVSPSDPLAHALETPTVTLGGSALSVGYAGLTPTLVTGVYQINATVPAGVVQGLQIPLVITQSGGSTTLYVRVVK